MIPADLHLDSVLRRAGQLIAVVVVVVLLTFGLIRIIPGDPAVNILGVKATPESVRLLRTELGLDKPFVDQLRDTFVDLAHGDLGRSLTLNTDVRDILLPALVVTLAVTTLAVLIAVCIGVPLGLTAGILRGNIADPVLRITSVGLLATPTVFISLIFIYLFALRLSIAPAGGWAHSWPEDLGNLWLPSAALSCYLIPIIARAVRFSTREALQQVYVEAAITRGLSPVRVACRHILPNALLPVLTIVGYNLGTLIGGAVVVESIFNLPGIGSVLVQAVGARDFPVVQGVALVTAVLVVLINLTTDIAYQVVDPRLRNRSGI